MSSDPPSPDTLGSVLVVGGCGFVGFHIVRYFSLEPSCTGVAVMSRNPNSNHLAGVSYHAGDISDPSNVRDMFR
jgi:sterol-4alpha-carboxylate 3-dehydrogenase (decarboxylating)